MLDDHSVTVTFQHFMASVFAGLATLAVWLLKRIGNEHIEHVKDIGDQLTSINEKLFDLSERTSRVEVLQERFDRECYIRHKTEGP